MMAQVIVSDDGDVTVICDTESDAEDEASRLAGLAMDALVERAASAAVAAWFEIHTEAAGDECATE